ncbi:MAG: alpha/beta hydrolase [Pseudomonadota bacterium]
MADQSSVNNFAPRHISKTHDGIGTPILFIPGFLETNSIWGALVLRTSPTLPDCYALSLPGHPPWIPKPDDNLTDEWIGQVADVIADLVATPVRLVGHSTGGLVALEIAQIRPDIVEDILLVGALNSGQVGGHKTITHSAAELPWIGHYILSAALNAWLSSEKSFRAGLASAMADMASQDNLPLEMREHMRSACPRTLHALLRWMSLRDGEKLSQVNCLVTNVIGTKDPVIAPAHQMQTLGLVENVTGVLLPTGHLPFIERPDLFDPIFRGWVLMGVNSKS